MTVGSRSTDERRRRRLAVKGEAGTDSAELGEGKPLPEWVPTELCAAAPWIPRAPWKLWTLIGLLYAGLAAVLAMVYRTPTFRAELTPALDPLFRGDQPRLVTYLEIIFWTLSGQLALLVGWHRAYSRLDFRGRYRFWPWAAAGMFATGLCVATNLHTELGAVLHQTGLLPHSTPRLGWLLPAFCVMLPLCLLMDRDVRRSTASLILLRLTSLLFLAGGAIGFYTPPWIEASLVPLIETGCGLIGSATLMVTLWVQGWYVAYVTPDPPVAAAASRKTSWFASLFGWMFGLIFGLFRWRKAEPEPKRRKKAEEGTATKRKRKTTKRKPRTRKVVEEEAESEEEEEAAEDEAEESEEEASDEDDYQEEEAEEEDTAPARVTAPMAKSNSPSGNNYRVDQRANQPPPPKSSSSWTSQQQTDDDEEADDDGDGENWQADGPSPDQLKGLSKRQRRALIKQHRDQQRANRGR